MCECVFYLRVCSPQLKNPFYTSEWGSFVPPNKVTEMCWCISAVTAMHKRTHTIDAATGVQDVHEH